MDNIETGWGPHALSLDGVKSFVDGYFAGSARVNGLTFTENATKFFKLPDEARKLLQEIVAGFMQEVERWKALPAGQHIINAPSLGISVDVGLGKTEAALAIIEVMSRSGLVHAEAKAVLLVPDHGLGAEIVERFKSKDIAAAVLRGRRADDPDVPGKKMCLNLDLTEVAREAGLKIEETCCRSRKGGDLVICPFHDRCGYQRQKAALRQSEVVVAAHNYLFHELPPSIGAVGITVVDENFVGAGLADPVELTVDGLNPTGMTVYHEATYYTSPVADPAETKKLVGYRAKLLAAQAGVPAFRPIPYDRLISEGLTAAACRSAAVLERQRVCPPKLRPDMDVKEARRRAEASRPHPWVPVAPAVTMWTLLADGLEKGRAAGGVTLAEEATEAGTRRSIRVREKKTVCAGWFGPDERPAPILALDATLRPELVGPFFSCMRFSEPVKALTPHVRFLQIIGAPQSAGEIIQSLDWYRSHISARANRFRRDGEGPDVLVVAQKKVREELEKTDLPDNVELAHFGALRGRDRWKSVACIIVIGRALPKSSDVERDISALTGHFVEPIDSDFHYRLPKRNEYIHRLNNGPVPVQVEYHPDESAEALRAKVSEDELLQAIGRGRGVRRTENDPLQVDLLCDLALPMAVNAVEYWKRELIMALHGLVLNSPPHMHAFYPDLYPSAQAAKRSKAESKEAENQDATGGASEGSEGRVLPLKRSIKEATLPSRGWIDLRYKVCDPKQNWRTARLNLDLHPDPGLALAERLGPVDWELTE